MIDSKNMGNYPLSFRVDKLIAINIRTMII